VALSDAGGTHGGAKSLIQNAMVNPLAGDDDAHKIKRAEAFFPVCILDPRNAATGNRARGFALSRVPLCDSRHD
jgi:hypothetical protein